MKKTIDFDAISGECIEWAKKHGFHAVLSWSINDQGQLYAFVYDAKKRETDQCFVRKI